MDALLILCAGFVGLLLLGAAARAFGADSREHGNTTGVHQKRDDDLRVD